MVYGQIVIDIRVLPDSQLDTVHTEGCAASGGLPLGSDLSEERRLRSLADLGRTVDHRRRLVVGLRLFQVGAALLDVSEHGRRLVLADLDARLDHLPR